MKTNKCLFMMTFATVLICGTIEGMPPELPKDKPTVPESKLISIDPEMSRRIEKRFEEKFRERLEWDPSREEIDAGIRRFILLEAQRARLRIMSREGTEGVENYLNEIEKQRSQTPLLRRIKPLQLRDTTKKGKNENDNLRL